MNNMASLEREVWDRIQDATKRHDGALLAHLGALADEIEKRKKDWTDRLTAGPQSNGTRHLRVHSSGTTSIRSSLVGDYTGRPIRQFEFKGVEIPVNTYKELLVRLLNLLREEHGEDFDRRALALGGRKRRYFSPDPRQLKYAHELEPGGLFVETNLNANLIVKICYDVLRALGVGDEKLKIR